MKNKLKELRSGRKMTQEELAEQIGVSRQTVNAIEKDKFDPSLTTAFKLAALFGMTIEELFEYQSDGKESEG